MPTSQGGTNGSGILSWSNNLNELYTTIGISVLTADEVNKLENIGANVGQFAQANTSGSIDPAQYNVAIGYEAFKRVSGTVSINGEYNIAIGYKAVSDLGSAATKTNCDHNIGIGYQTLYSITTGYDNTILGNAANVNYGNDKYSIALGGKCKFSR